MTFHVSGTGGSLVHDTEWPQQVRVSAGEAEGSADAAEEVLLVARVLPDRFLVAE